MPIILHEEDAPPARQPTSPRLAPTVQQEAIVTAYTENKPVILVVALAGTGKTSTCRMAFEATTSTPSAYLVYNSAAAEEARRTMPGHIFSGTTHSFAYRAQAKNDPLGRSFGRVYGDRLQKKPAELYALIRQDFKAEISRVTYSLGVTGTRPAVEAMLDTIRRFCQSADQEISVRHAPEAVLSVVANKFGAKAALDCVEKIVSGANRIWERMIDVNDRNMPITHDVYLKLWSLQGVSIRQSKVVLDEAQDANPVVIDILSQLQKQGTQICLIGDPHQSIYQWRGAVDAMKSFPEIERLPLTTSWRYGQNIADTAMPLLAASLEPNRLIGGGKNPGWVSDHGDIDTPCDAILSRSNAGMAEEVLMEIDRGGAPFIQLRDKIEMIKLVEAVYCLSIGEEKWHKDIALFRSFSELEEFSRGKDGGELHPAVSIVKRFKSRTPGLLEAIENNSAKTRSEATVVCSTIHSAKGLEFKHVRFAEDVLHLSLTQEYPPEEEGGAPTYSVNIPNVNLAYVAITRAKDALSTSGALGVWAEDFRRLVSSPENKEEGQAVRENGKRHGIDFMNAFAKKKNRQEQGGVGITDLAHEKRLMTSQGITQDLFSEVF